MDASSSYSGSSESIALDETYYKNQPPPLNYESIKENVIKIETKQRKKMCQFKGEEATNRIEIQPPRYGKLNNLKSRYDSNSRSQPVKRNNPHNRPGSNFASSRDHHNRNTSLQSNFQRTRQPELSQCRAEFKSEAEEPVEDDMCIRILSCLCKFNFC
nr:unnamed protein product [Callosobruchus analis]